MPQGTILGTLLFLINVNNLYKVSRVISTTMFAEDIFFYSKKDIKHLFNTKELSRMETFHNENKLSLNTKKTYILPI